MTDSLIAIDAGNTRIKWGVDEGGRWVASGAMATADAGLPTALAALPAGHHAAIASNVAGPHVRRALEEWAARASIALRFIRAESRQLGVTNGYRDGAQLGADRWAALVAAHRREPGHKLVASAGTALTLDALSEAGEFLGGVIVPGPALMRRSLDKGTAGLAEAAGRFEDLPRATSDAIASGAIQACVGAIERMEAAMARRGAAPARIILSGGAAAELQPHLSARCVLHPHLVLDGLVLIAREA